MSTSTESKTATSGPRDFSSYPKDVGIVALDIVFPRQYVTQSDLEQYDGVSAGKYTIGLGQTELAFCSDAEDMYSLSLTAVSSFMRKFNISYSDIGRLEVGTETIMDHAKAVKTVLMQLFAESGNSDIEGVDCMNACYGGTNALFNSVAWVESSAWDGRYAMVVCGDIAEYAKGPARPTSGAGVVVMLIGANAPLVVERGVRATHMEHTYDFYKPNLHSPFPVVDGALSQSCYIKSVDKCYRGYVSKFAKVYNRPFVLADDSLIPLASDASSTSSSSSSSSSSSASSSSSPPPPPPADVDYFIFHAPYNKLIQKGLARAFFTDARLRSSSSPAVASTAAAARLDSAFTAFSSMTEEVSYGDRNVEQAAVAVTKGAYNKLTAPSTLVPKRLGNLYTASLYAGLVSLVHTQAAKLAGKRVLCFSYGSGLAASLFSIRVPPTPAAINAINSIVKNVDIETRLASRTLRTPKELEVTLAKREAAHALEGAFTPDDNVTDECAFEGAYYLVGKDDKGRRQYAVWGADAK